MIFFKKFMYQKIFFRKKESLNANVAKRFNMQIYKIFNNIQQCKLLTSKMKCIIKF